MKDRFDVKEGTVVDHQTGLMWMQNPLEIDYLFKEACSINWVFGGYSNWRLPTIQELIHIINFGKPRPHYYSEFNFFDHKEKTFWSSSFDMDLENYLLVVQFNYGIIDCRHLGKKSSVILVRSNGD